MSQNQKNQAMVDAFGSGKPPVMSTGGKTKEKRGGRQRKSDNSDIDAIFRGIRSTRGMVRRGLSGEILNPDGTDPGNSFDRFMRQNPHLKGASQRQVEYDQQRQKPARSFLPGQSSPPGGASGAMVGAPQSSGNPGGETLFGSVPEFKSSGMRKPVEIAGPPIPQMGPNDGPKPDWNSILGYGANTGPVRNNMRPNDGPQNPLDFGPQLPYSSPEQLMALKRLSGFSGDNNPTLNALEATWNNIFPGVKDYDYLRNLFPGLVHPQAGAGQIWAELAKMYQSPAYQSQFRNVNQSEFYK